MSRTLARTLPVLPLLAVAAPAAGADFAAMGMGDWAYQESWQYEEPLSFEAGLRYWHAFGRQGFGLGGADYTADDQSQIVEAHIRIDDRSTSSFLKGLAGYAAVINGTYTTPLTPPGGTTMDTGRIGYAGADFGYFLFGDPHDGVGAGAFVGYQYWNEAPDMGRANFIVPEAGVITGTNIPAGGNSRPHNLDIHALRLGLATRATFGDRFDINAEIAAIPYARLDGELGGAGTADFGVGTAFSEYQSSATAVSGNLYGAAAELMVGFHVTDNLTVRAGGRGWYLTGPADVTFTRTTIADTDNDPTTAPSISNQAYITNTDWFSLMRYGALLEVTGRF